MNPVRINVMGDDFSVFSLPYGNFDVDFLRGYEFDYAVVLTPSIKADFYIKTYSKRRNLIEDNYAAAISAAAFLILLRGLPLSEIRFETDFGFIDVFNTGDGFFSVVIQKCKELFTKTSELLGCEIEYTDVSVTKTVRVIKTSSIENFDISVLSGFLFAGDKLPDAVALSSRCKEKLYVTLYNEFNPEPPTSLHCFAAAAYLEKAAFKEKISLDDNVSYCVKEYSTLRVLTKPTIVK